MIAIRSVIKYIANSLSFSEIKLEHTSAEELPIILNTQASRNSLCHGSYFAKRSTRPRLNEIFLKLICEMLNLWITFHAYCWRIASLASLITVADFGREWRSAVRDLRKSCYEIKILKEKPSHAVILASTARRLESIIKIQFPNSSKKFLFIVQRISLPNFTF